MTVVTAHNNFGAQEKFCHCFHFFPSVFHEVMGLDALILVSWMLSFESVFSLSYSTFIKKLLIPSRPARLAPIKAIPTSKKKKRKKKTFWLFSTSSLSAVRIVSSAYLRLLIFHLAILITALFSLAFSMTYSAYKLNKQGNNTQPWCTAFPIVNQSVVPCLVLTVASWPAYRFVRRQVRWLGIPHLFNHFPVYCDPDSQRLWYNQWSRSRCFSAIPYFLLYSGNCTICNPRILSEISWILHFLGSPLPGVLRREGLST